LGGRREFNKEMKKKIIWKGLSGRGRGGWKKEKEGRGGKEEGDF